jgi:hypothetical protein
MESGIEVNMQSTGQLDRLLPRSVVWNRMYLLTVLLLLPVLAVFFFASGFVQALRSR